MNAALEFLTLSDILEIHTDQIEKYGGETGIRDMSLLKSAIAMPAAGFGGQYFHDNIYQMAAAYLFHIVQNHPFVDGNKRTGALATVVFLDLNGQEFNSTNPEFEKLVLSVACGEKGKLQIAEFLCKRCKEY